LTLTLFLLSDRPAEWLVREDPLPSHCDAVLVMAGDPGYERTTTAARLVTEGRARLLIATGGEPGPGDSASSLRDWARRKGVRDEQIRVEQLSAGTWSSMLAVRPILEAEQVRTVVLVTSPYHQRRAHAAARKAFGPGIEVLSHAARPSSWSPHRWWATTHSRRVVVSEYLKLAYYAARGWI
jgi:uncharacterized SAM-binding protein YcdF (DUF218 family)